MIDGELRLFRDLVDDRQGVHGDAGDLLDEVDDIGGVVELVAPIVGIVDNAVGQKAEQ